MLLPALAPQPWRYGTMVVLVGQPIDCECWRKCECKLFVRCGLTTLTAATPIVTMPVIMLLLLMMMVMPVARIRSNSFRFDLVPSRLISSRSPYTIAYHTTAQRQSIVSRLVSSRLDSSRFSSSRLWTLIFATTTTRFNDSNTGQVLNRVIGYDTIRSK